MTDITTLIDTLDLTAHPEGGYYRRTYQSDESLSLTARDDHHPRHCGTAIYYLLPASDYSAWHRIRSDELWHHYHGDTLAIHSIATDGRLKTQLLGAPDQDTQPQVMAPRDVWFCAEVIKPHAGYALCGCTVIPGFDFRDFEMANPQKLNQQYPQHKAIIDRLSRV